MRIVLDFSPVLQVRYSGFWTYGVGLAGALSKLDQVDSICLLVSQSELKEAGSLLFLSHPKIRLVAMGFPLRLWEQWWRAVSWPSLHHSCGQFDVYHSLDHLMPPTGRRARVLTVHDLRRYRLPDLYARAKLGPFERAVAAADRILAVSQCTRLDLIELAGADPARVDVVYEGTPSGFAPLEPHRKRATLDMLSRRFARRIGDFAITISSRDRRKNILGAICAFGKVLAKLPPDFFLIVAGNIPDDPDMYAELSSQALAKRVILAGPIGRDEFPAVLAASRMLLFLSRYEGFGLPLLEAMASGVPVIATNCSSIPEVAGDAAILVEHDDTAGASQQIVELATDDELWSDRVRAGLERSRQFTWQAAAEQTIACYRRAIEAKGP